MFKNFAMAAFCLAASQVGFGATEVKEQDKDFVWYCESDEATAAQKKTVAAIYEVMNLAPDKVGCKEAFDVIRAKEKLEFDFYFHTLSDLSPLKGFDNLRDLACAYSCNVEVIETIPTLHNLKNINAADAGLTRLPDFSRFKNLKVLNLDGNPITHIRNAQGIKGIETLIMNSTSLENADFAANLHELKNLYLSHSKIENFDNFPVLPNLRFLAVENMKINDCSFLVSFSNLHSLLINNNKLSSLDCFAANSKIYEIEAVNNKITGSSIKLPQSIVRLDLSDNPIGDLEFLKGKDNLSRLFLSNTGITKWDEIKALKNELYELVVSKNEIAENIVPSGTNEEWPKLEHLNIESTSIKSLSFFKQMTTPRLSAFVSVDIENKTEENCPTSGVPEVVAEFCKQ